MTCKTLAQDIDASIGATNNESSDSFVFTRSGTAYKIPFASMSSSLGVTGTISSVGGPSSVSILNKPSSGLNFIRGISTSQGISATLDAFGAINVKTNLANAGGSVALIKDPTAAQVAFRGFSAGPGIQVELSGDGNAVEVSTTTATAATKTVIINTVEDFPTAINGVITLAEDTDYFLANDIATANRFVTPSDSPVIIRSPDSRNVTLSYTGAGDMFSGLNPVLIIKDVAISAVSGKVFEYATSTLGSISITSARISGDDLGNIGRVANFFIDQMFVQSVGTKGFLFSGTALAISISNVFVSNIAVGTFFDLGSATFNRFKIDAVTVASSGAGTVFLSGLVSSGNIVAGTLAQVEGVTLSGSISNLVNISENDARYFFSQCNNIPNTRPDTLLSLSAPATTTIATVSTPALVNGTWTVERQSQMTGTAAGRVTYNGERNATLPISATLSVEPVSGTNKAISLFFYKNGAQIASSEITLIVSSGTPRNLSLTWQDSWAQSDYYEVYVENNTDAIDIIVDTAVIRVN